MRISDWSSDVCSSELGERRDIGDVGQPSARQHVEIPREIVEFNLIGIEPDAKIIGLLARPAVLRRAEHDHDDMVRALDRSEERRQGTAVFSPGRSRRSQYHKKKKTTISNKKNK